MAITSFLDRFPRARHAVHSSVDLMIVAGARTGLDLNRRRVRVGESAIPESARIRLTQLAEAELVPVTAPAAAYDLEPAAYSDLCARIARGYARPASGLLEMTDARFHVPSGFVSVGTRLPSEAIPLLYFPHAFNLVPVTRTLFASAAPVADGVLINLPLSHSYYHWLCEVLPRALTAAAHTPSHTPLYLSEDLPAFVFESLKVLGLWERCVPLPPGVYSAHRLTVPTFERAEWPAPRDLRTIRTRIRESFELPTSGRRRLLISRADAIERKLLNEDHLLSALGDHGFERVILNGLSLEDQVRIFAEAEMVIAPHGAGMTNLLFAPSDCRVVELVVDSHYSPSYLILTSNLGQPYGYVRCAERKRHLVADPGAVRAVLAALDGSGIRGHAGGAEEMRPQRREQEPAAGHQLADQEGDAHALDAASVQQGQAQD